MAVTETNGHSLKKGRLRIIGTLFGVLMAFIFVGLFAQQPLYLLLAYFLLVAVCVYQQTNPRNGYAWTVSLMVASLVIGMGHLDSESTFDIAVLRMQETILGVFCFTLVFNHIWPVSSRVLLMATLHDYFNSQAQQLNTALDELQQGRFNTNFPLGVSLQRLTRLEDLLQAASADSYQVSSNYPLWRQLQQQLSEWALLCGHLSEASTLFNSAFSSDQCEKLVLLQRRMQQRAASAEQLLQANSSAEQTAYINPLSMTLRLSGSQSYANDNAAYQQYSGLHMLEQVLSDMDALHYAILHTLYLSVSDQLPPPESATPIMSQLDSSHTASPIQLAAWWVFDSERAIHALKVCLILLICIGLWIYVPMTGGPMIVMFGSIFGSVVLSIPFANTRSMLLYIVGWSCLFLLEYIFIMPALTEIWQLGSFYFFNVFVLWFLFNRPQQMLHRLLGSLFMVLMTKSAIAASPSYDVLQALVMLLIISIAILIISFVNHSVFSGAPERVFLRQLVLLRYSLKKGFKDLLISAERRPLIDLPTPLQVVVKAEAASQQINWRSYPDVDPDQITSLISHGYRLCLHYRAFRDSYSQWRQAYYHPEIDAFIRTAISDIGLLLGEKLYCTTMVEHSAAIDQLLDQLQDYLEGQSKHTIAPLSLGHQQADTSYQLLTSLSLLIDALNTLKHHSQSNQLQTLRLSPFSLG
jgi:uncharacterized membrane protein YccC